MDHEPAYRYRATVERIIDGDTFILDIDLGFRVSVALRIRLRGVDAPELPTPQGTEARVFAAGEMTGRQLVIESYRDQQSFERWIADVYMKQFDGSYVSLGDRMVEAGHALRLPSRA